MELFSLSSEQSPSIFILTLTTVQRLRVGPRRAQSARARGPCQVKKASKFYFKIPFNSIINGSLLYKNVAMITCLTLV